MIRYILIAWCAILLLSGCREAKQGNKVANKSESVVNFTLPNTVEHIDSVYTSGLHRVSSYYDTLTNEKVADVKFHDNGQPYTDIRYKSGMRNGTSYSYREDGTPWSMNTYRDDQLHGPYKTWHENGQLMIDGNFLNGKENGDWLFYYEDGRLDTRGLYVNGEKKGIWTTYNKEGKLIRTLNYSEK